MNINAKIAIPLSTKKIVVSSHDVFIIKLIDKGFHR